MPMTCAGCGAEIWSATVVTDGPPKQYACHNCWAEVYRPAEERARREEQRRRGLRPEDGPAAYEPPHPEDVRPFPEPYGWMKEGE